MDREPQVSRKRNPQKKPLSLVKRSLVSTATFAASLGGPAELHAKTQAQTPVSNPAYEQQVQSEVARLQQDIESRYNVRLSVREDFARFGWNPRSLSVLDYVFSQFPQHIIGPDQVGRRLNIEVNQRSASCCAWSQDEVRASIPLFELMNRHTAAATLGHELVHKVSDEPMPNAYSGHTQRFRYAEEIEALLGQPFVRIAPAFGQRRDLLLESYRQQSRDTTEEAYFLRTMQHALVNDSEFHAEAGAHFVLGKEYFLRVYQLLLSQEQAERLYDMMKEIFQKEFEPDTFNEVVPPPM